MGASLPFTNGETESQRQSYSSGCPDRQLRMAIPPICRGAGALPVGAKLPTLDDQGHWLPGIGMASGTHPSVSKSLGFPSGILVILQLPSRGKGQGARLDHLGPS